MFFINCSTKRSSEDALPDLHTHSHFLASLTQKYHTKHRTSFNIRHFVVVFQKYFCVGIFILVWDYMCVGARRKVGKPWVTFFITFSNIHMLDVVSSHCLAKCCVLLLSTTFLIVASPVFTKGDLEDGESIANEDALIACDNC